jgi:hypothetical protein
MESLLKFIFDKTVLLQNYSIATKKVCDKLKKLLSKIVLWDELEEERICADISDLCSKRPE